MPATSPEDGEVRPGMPRPRRRAVRAGNVDEFLNLAKTVMEQCDVRSTRPQSAPANLLIPSSVDLSRDSSVASQLCELEARTPETLPRPTETLPRPPTDVISG